MKRKTLYVTISVCILLFFFIYRMYDVNKDVPTRFNIEYYTEGEKVICDELEVTVLSHQIGNPLKEYDGKFVPITIKMDIKNNSYQPINVVRFIESPLGIGNYKFETNEGDFDGKKLKRIKPNETYTFTLIYNVKQDIVKNKKKPIYLYINQELYQEQIMEHAKQGNRYGKAVEL